MTKKSTEAKYFGKPEPVSVKFRFQHLCSSAAKCSNPDHPELAPHCANLNFSSTLEMHVFRQNIQLVTTYKQYGPVQGYLETPRYPWSF